MTEKNSILFSIFEIQMQTCHLQIEMFLKQWMKEKSKISGKISIRLASQAKLENDKVELFIYPGKWYYSNVLPKEIPEVLESHFQHYKNSDFSCKKIEREQIFICTHGRHDKCCAKFGQKLADQMHCTLRSAATQVPHSYAAHVYVQVHASIYIKPPCG